MARERNDAESYAKDKIFMSNVKSQKIKVLKDQLKKKGKKKINVENVPENTKDLKDDDIMSKLSKVKSHKILNKFDGDKPRRSIMKNIKGSDSEISSILKEINSKLSLYFIFLSLQLFPFVYRKVIWSFIFNYFRIIYSNFININFYLKVWLFNEYEIFTYSLKNYEQTICHSWFSH